MGDKNQDACNCTQHFNRLTPAEAERLAMLIEECGEVIQIAGKILRHGYESHHPRDPKVTNRALLGGEITDLFAAAQRVIMIDKVPFGNIEQAWAKKMRYSHHQLENSHV